jgi:hypothetical protein
MVESEKTGNIITVGFKGVEKESGALLFKDILCCLSL